MTTPDSAGTRADDAAPEGPSEMTGRTLPVPVRRYDRTCFWRVVLGALGLFWVCVLLLLMG